MKASTFFTREEQSRIREAIIEAEKASSGEIRVHIETAMEGEVLDRAAWIFKKIGMHRTIERNGVLFYLALDNRQYAIIGDRGINVVVPEGFWDEVKEILSLKFNNGNFTEGLVEGIRITGSKLKEHFPRSENDINELTDEISFDDIT